MKTVALLTLLFSLNISFAQEGNSPEKDSVVVFDNGTAAQFPGGSRAMFQFIAENVIYPKEALDKGASGNVYISFTVDTLGNIKDIKIDRGVSESIDKESIRVIQSMPKWEPATFEGKKVASRQRLPIRFKLAK